MTPEKQEKNKDTQQRREKQRKTRNEKQDTQQIPLDTWIPWRHSTFFATADGFQFETVLFSVEGWITFVVTQPEPPEQTLAVRADARSTQERGSEMPGCARRELLLRDEVQVVHCYTRCVRRAFLAGVDPLTGKDFSFRRDWIYSLLEQQAALFGIEAGFHVQMRNHLHLVLRTRPDVVKRWSKEKVVRNWLKITKLKRGSDITDWEPSEERVRMEMADPKRVKRLRRRLSKVSWYMATLCENVARRANKQDEVTGKFFEQRYGLRDLADEGAILVCGMYVDLNQIRAGEALTPEESYYTSAYDRIQGRRFLVATAKSPEVSITRRDRWLCELTLNEGPRADLSHDECSVTPWRASDKGLLPISLDEYLRLLDWTGRQVRQDQPGAIPSELAPILLRLQVNEDNWLQTVSEFESRFGHVVGRVESIAQAAARMGRRWLAGSLNASQAFN